MSEHGFKAEVQQLLNLMIHSVYSDREVFLRELVSNSADALDKARFLELTRDDLVPVGTEEPGIRVLVDEEARTITVEDDGIGMTEQEVIDNLGTIARSGTGNFLEKLKSEADAPTLIGQFGVGFYASFMVASDVTVTTRSALPDEPAIRWHSRGEGTYTVEPAERETRGTTVVLRLRDDAFEDFGQAFALSTIVKKHSNFLPWPILVDGEQANAGEALWVKQPSQVDDEAANAFYKSIATDWRDPALRVHVSIDSPIQYSALLFVPSERPFDLFDPYAERGPRLYAKRVLIVEHARDLLPEWLRFVRGVVDSEDISLNVSREMVQKTPIIRKIKDALTKRVLKTLNKTADKKPDDYLPIWRNFGAVLKEGYYHGGEAWADMIRPLLRFNALSHEDEDGLMSLQDYVDAMPEGQDTIWYLAGESRDSCLQSPHLEAFQKKGWDVLLLTENVDEWLAVTLTKFGDHEVKSITRGELELDDEEAGESADISGLAPWMHEVLEGAVANVRSSSRLTESACVLVDDDQGMSANLERILRSANQDVPMPSKRILEINPRHPLIQNLAKLHETGKLAAAKPLAELLYDDALLLEGTVKEPTAMGRRLQALLQTASEAALGADA